MFNRSLHFSSNKRIKSQQSKQISLRAHVKDPRACSTRVCTLPIFPVPARPTAPKAGQPCCIIKPGVRKPPREGKTPPCQGIFSAPTPLKRVSWVGQRDARWRMEITWIFVLHFFMNRLWKNKQSSISIAFTNLSRKAHLLKQGTPVRVFHPLYSKKKRNANERWLVNDTPDWKLIDGVFLLPHKWADTGNTNPTH